MVGEGGPFAGGNFCFDQPARAGTGRRPHTKPLSSRSLVQVFRIFVDS